MTCIHVFLEVLEIRLRPFSRTIQSSSQLDLKKDLETPKKLSAEKAFQEDLNLLSVEEIVSTLPPNPYDASDIPIPSNQNTKAVYVDQKSTKGKTSSIVPALSNIDVTLQNLEEDFIRVFHILEELAEQAFCDLVGHAGNGNCPETNRNKSSNSAKTITGVNAHESLAGLFQRSCDLHTGESFNSIRISRFQRKYMIYNL